MIMHTLNMPPSHSICIEQQSIHKHKTNWGFLFLLAHIVLAADVMRGFGSLLLFHIVCCSAFHVYFGLVSLLCISWHGACGVELSTSDWRSLISLEVRLTDVLLRVFGSTMESTFSSLAPRQEAMWLVLSKIAKEPEPRKIGPDGRWRIRKTG